MRSILLALGLLILSLVKYGLGPFPNFNALRGLAEEWASVGALPPDAGYLGHSPVHVILLGTLGWTSVGSFALGSFLLHIVAVCLPVLMPIVRRDPVIQGLVAVVLAGGAVLPTLTFWIGTYDTVTVIAATVAVLAATPILRGVGWFVFGVQHSEMAVIALLCLVLLSVVHARSSSTRFAVGSLALPVSTVVAGSMLTMGLARSWGLDEDRAGYLAEAGGAQATASLYWPVAWLVTFGALGVVWFMAVDSRVRSDPVTRAFLVVALVVSLALPQLVLDEVRVPAIVLLGPTFGWILLVRDRLPDAAEGLLRTYLPIAVILPVVLVWEGLAYFPGRTPL